MRSEEIEEVFYEVGYRRFGPLRTGILQSPEEGLEREGTQQQYPTEIKCGHICHFNFPLATFLKTKRNSKIH